MAEHPAARTLAALATMVEQMQFLVEHPRMQQKRWVARGREWLPILAQAQADLRAETTQYQLLAETHQALLDALGRAGDSPCTSATARPGPTRGTTRHPSEPTPRRRAALAARLGTGQG